MNHVIGIIREEESGFRLSFPDFPGLQADGETLAAAVGRAAEVVAAEITDRNAPFPTPANMDMLDTGQPDWMGRGIAVLVPLPLQAATEQAAEAGKPSPGDVPPAEGQVPLSGRVSPEEVPTDKARSAARLMTDGGAGAVQRSTDDL
ncbi:type II toxin-antitoxin system HicB family antitoxin [Xanthobacter sp.]|uniref:type II toxin-antitoxin system HicB family antitoxin n=1 Tax=Xanthobacter sp. TaxID=35809 RepID=UPI0025E99EA0|nr:type II toxin-antitoxin system HicB family antitoxin [Xanthobacter sp.]